MWRSKTGKGMPTSDRRVKKGFPQEEFELRVKGCLVRDEGREVENRARLGARWDLRV